MAGFMGRKNIFTKLNDISVRNKLLLLYVICVLIPITVTNTIFYKRISKNAREQELTNISMDVTKTQMDFKRIINESIVLSHSIYTDKVLNTFLEKNYRNSEEYYETYYNYLKSLRERYIYSYYNISDVNIYTDNPGVLDSGGYLQITDEVKSSKWYEEFSNSNNQIIICSFFEEKNGIPHQQLSLIRRLNNINNLNEYNKILKIDLHYKVISQILGSSIKKGTILLIDNDNRIIFKNDKNKLEEDFNLETYDSNIFKTDDIIIREEIQGIDALNNWRMVAVIPRNELIDISKELVQFVIMIALINFFVATVFIYFISRSFHRRLTLLSAHVKEAGNENFLTMKNEGDDEIGQLIKEYNRMVTIINELINDVYKSEIKSQNLELENKQARINALQSQINPHFLFNTLETIRMRSISKKEIETASIIKQLSSTFRRAISWDSEWISIEDEIKFIEDFLSIQQYRFDDRISYLINVSDDIKHYKIPKMCIQPFIENASIHGIERISEQGVIKLNIELDNNVLKFNINDNGIGMDEAKLAEVKSSIENVDSRGEHIGIANVYRRMKLIYDDDFKFDIKSSKFKGTSISFSIPVMEEI